MLLPIIPGGCRRSRGLVVTATLVEPRLSAGGPLGRGRWLGLRISAVLIELGPLAAVALAIVGRAALGRGISLVAALRMYLDMVQSGSLTVNLVQSGMFLALGLWISWGIITRTSRQEVKQAAATVSTLLPLDYAAREP